MLKTKEYLSDLAQKCITKSRLLGATDVDLVGFSTRDVGQWSGVTDKKRKLIKLKWMNKVLNILSLRAQDEE